MKLSCLILTSCVFLLISSAEAYERVVVFGDSLSDNGNTATRTFGFSPGPAPHWNGRYSNGPVWTEHLITALGLSSTSVNYAHGGGQAKAGETEYQEGFFTVRLPNTGYNVGSDDGSQFYLFDADTDPGDDLSDDLFVINGGAVNYSSQGETNPGYPGTPPPPASALIRLIEDLYAMGAREFMVANLPDLGKTPGGLDETDAPPTSADLSRYAMEFNTSLLLQLDDMRNDPGFDGISLYHLDLFSFLNEVIENPIGDIVNVTDAAIAAPGAPTDPDDPFYDTYLFFDDYHPTAFGHEELGNLAFQTLTSVPEPGAVSMLAVASLLIAARHRKEAS